MHCESEAVYGGGWSRVHRLFYGISLRSLRLCVESEGSRGGAEIAEEER